MVAGRFKCTDRQTDSVYHELLHLMGLSYHCLRNKITENTKYLNDLYVLVMGTVL